MSFHAMKCVWLLHIHKEEKKEIKENERERERERPASFSLLRPLANIQWDVQKSFAVEGRGVRGGYHFLLFHSSIIKWIKM